MKLIHTIYISTTDEDRYLASHTLLIPVGALRIPPYAVSVCKRGSVFSFFYICIFCFNYALLGMYWMFYMIWKYEGTIQFGM